MKSVVKKVSGLTLFLLMLQCILVVIPVVHASPKSLYLVANHHTRQFDAWEIKPDGTATYQATYWLSYATDPAGIAIDESSNTLFITSEFSGGVEMVDATTMTSLGVSTGPSDLAGIAVNDAKDIVYTVERYSNTLYAYDWNPVARTLTLKSGYPVSLLGCSGAFGIALDEIRGMLWVADSAAGVVRAYDVNTWTEDASKSFTPSHKAVDVAVDRWRGFVYTVSMSAAAWVPPGCGSRLLSKYDLTAGTETTGTLVDQGVGVAVDEVTGFVYVTLSPYGRGLYQGDLSVWDTSTTPWTELQRVKVSGSPAGICIPQEEVAYNPLGLSKDDGLAEGQCVSPGEEIIYKICYDNTKNAYDVHNVKIVDKLPVEVDFVSATAPGFVYPTGLAPTAPDGKRFYGYDGACTYYEYAGWLARGDKDWNNDGKKDYWEGYYHIGQDIPASVGDNVYAIANGTVISISGPGYEHGWDYQPGDNNLGILVKHTLDDSTAFLALYGHVHSSVSLWDEVQAGEPFATVGPWGSEPHLHFGIHPGPNIPKSNKTEKIGWGAMGLDHWLDPNGPDTNGFEDPIKWITTRTPKSSVSVTYDSSTRTVTWDIGTLSAGATQQCVHLVVRVSSAVAPGSTIVNYATIDSDETLPTTVSESTDVCPLPGEIGLLVNITPTPKSCNVSETITFEVTVTNLADIAGTDLTAYYVQLSVIEPEEIEIDVPAGGMDIAKILPGESKSTTFSGKAVKAGDNVEVIVNAWGYTDLSDEVGKIRGRGNCTVTIHDPKAPKPDWSFAIITDIHIGYNSPRWDSDYDGYKVGEIDYGGAGWDDPGPYDAETIKRLDYEVTRNLENAVDKIITEKGPYNIKFVVVLGDISDTAEKSEFLKAREILNRLNDPNEDGNTEDGIPYIPLFGNHDPWPYVQDIQGKDDRSRYAGNLNNPYIAPYAKGDEFFKDIFWGESNDKNKKLIEELFGDSWEYTYDKPVHRKAVPKARKVLGKLVGESCGFDFLPCVEERPDGVNTYYDKDDIEPTIFECDYYLQNYGFTYAGITFVCLDLVPRLGADINPMNGNALPGTARGFATDHPETLKFSKEYISRHNPIESKKIVLLSHYPLGPSVLNYIPLGLFGYDVYGFFGHVHVTGSYSLPIIDYFGGIPVTSYMYHGIVTEDVADILPEWCPAPVAEALKILSKLMDYGRTRKTVRIVKVTNGEVDYSTILKPKSVEIRWPFPDFAYSYASYPEPNKEITFTAYFTTYHGFRTSFDWDFGDGTYGSGLSVTHMYPHDGEYIVTLTVTTTNLMTGEKKTYSITRSVYVRTKHIISTLSLDLNATSLLTGEDLTQVPKNTYEPALITKKTSEEIPVALFGVHFEVATEDVDLSTLVADVDLVECKSVLCMPSWPGVIEDYKTLFIPSTGAGTVYICLSATILDEVSLENADLIINVGETKDNITVTTTFYNGREYYLVLGVTGTGGGELKDTIPPTTLLTIGEPKYLTEITYVTPDTPFNLTATDNPGGTGVALTAYKIQNATYDSGWLTYTEPFRLTGLADGVYSLDYNSTDNAHNVEPTNTINITLFSWNYVFEDTYGRGTILKINLAHKFFQFITPDKDYGIKKATYMRQCGRAIIIKHYDSELRLITVAVDTKLDFCVAIAWDVETRTRYFLIDKVGIE